MKIKIDLELCQGHSVCMEECPEVFEVIEQGGTYPQVNVLVRDPAEGLRSKVEAAAQYCPNRVITVED